MNTSLRTHASAADFGEARLQAWERCIATLSNKFISQDRLVETLGAMDDLIWGAPHLSAAAQAFMFRSLAFCENHAAS